MSDIEKIELIDEMLDSFENLSTLWDKVKNSKEAQEWLSETMEHITENLDDDYKNMIPEDYLNKEIR